MNRNETKRNEKGKHCNQCARQRMKARELLNYNTHLNPERKEDQKQNQTHILYGTLLENATTQLFLRPALHGRVVYGIT